MKNSPLAHLNHYERLGLSRNATSEEITAAYRERLRLLRTQITQGSAPPPDYMDDLREAYKILSDPWLRHEYDDEQWPPPADLTIIPPPTLFDPIASPPPPNNSSGKVDNRSRRSEYQFEFVGNGGEYFRIWIVNLLLSIVTLGIYSAWAKVRREQYFHRNLLLDGKGFDYHGTPKAILKGRAIAFVAFMVISAASSILPILQLLILPVIPWMLVRAFHFRAANSSFCNLRFHFSGEAKEAAKVFLGYGFLSSISFGLLFPAFYRQQRLFVLNNTAYGTAKFHTDFSNKEIYSVFMKPGLAFLGLSVVMGIIVSFFAKGKAALALLGILPLFFVLLAFLWVVLYGWVQVNLFNLIWNNTRVAKHRFISRLETKGYLKLIIKNWLLTFVTLGLYWPWAKVAVATYRAERTKLLVRGSLEGIVAQETQAIGALGDEAADMFDFDVAL